MFKIKDYSYSSLYVVTCSLATVLIENLVTNLSPLVALFYVTIIAILYFHIVSYKKIWSVYKIFFKEHKQSLLFVNLCIIVMWMCTYYGNFYSSPTVYNYLYFTTLGIISKFKTVNTIKNSLFRVSIGILLIMIPFFICRNQTLGAILAVIGGTSTLLYNILTYKLTSKTSITATQTLAVRFWGLLIVLLFIIGNRFNLEVPTIDIIFKLILLAFLSFILQIWLSQKGLYAIGVKYHGIIISLTPLGTLLLQGLILHQWYWNFLALTMICPFILNDLLWQRLMFFKVADKVM